MSISGILSSPAQRSLFIWLSTVIIVLFVTLVLIIYHFSPDDRGWNLLLDVLVALVSAVIFFVASTIFAKHLFDDPLELSVANKLLPQDIELALRDMAESATEYRIFVRTGRHFRSEILPILVKTAVRQRRPVIVHVILLDFRNGEICEKYASFRKSSSFDRFHWTQSYVQTEILATILKLIEAAHQHPALVKFNLYLTSRLSNFRIDGSQDQIIVTREDPKDVASRFRFPHSEFSAHLNEFTWIRDEAFMVEASSVTGTRLNDIEKMFGNCDVVLELKGAASEAMDGPSPYIR